MKIWTISVRELTLFQVRNLRQKLQTLPTIEWTKKDAMDRFNLILIWNNHLPYSCHQILCIYRTEYLAASVVRVFGVRILEMSLSASNLYKNSNTCCNVYVTAANKRKCPTNILLHTIKQDCIPVGCVVPACCLYLPACTVLGGVCSGEGVCSRGVPGPGGCLLLGWGVPASGPRGVYPSMQWGRHPPLWTESQKRVKHNLVPTSLRVVINDEKGHKVNVEKNHVFPFCAMLLVINSPHMNAPQGLDLRGDGSYTYRNNNTTNAFYIYDTYSFLQVPQIRQALLLLSWQHWVVHNFWLVLCVHYEPLPSSIMVLLQLKLYVK